MIALDRLLSSIYSFFNCPFCNFSSAVCFNYYSNVRSPITLLSKLQELQLTAVYFQLLFTCLFCSYYSIVWSLFPKYYSTVCSPIALQLFVFPITVQLSDLYSPITLALFVLQLLFNCLFSI